MLLSVGNNTIIQNLNIPRLMMTLRLRGALSDIIKVCDLKCSLTFNSVLSE